MKNYKLISSTHPMFKVGMEVPMEFEGIEIGDEIQFLTDLCTCTQDIGIIMLNRNGNGEDDLGAVYSFEEVPEEIPEVVYPRRVTIDTVDEDIRVNGELDIFLGNKTIMLSPTDRMTRSHGITPDALYRAVKKEWGFIKKMPGHENTAFPLELEESAVGKYNLVLWDYWDFTKGSSEFLVAGSYNRKIVQVNGKIKIL